MSRAKKRTLDRFLSWCGVASRPQAARLVEAGRVAVNGRIERDASRWVLPSDEVRVDGERLSGPAPTELHLYHKPRGVLVTESDPEGRAVYRDDLPAEFLERGIRAVGRLDRASAGLLLLTNDTQLADRLLAGAEVAKVYHVKLAPRLEDADLEPWRQGVDIGDSRPTASARVRVLRQNPKSTVVECTLHEGRNRQIRRMAAAIGREVEWLVRVAFGPLALGELRPGEHRPATTQELAALTRIDPNSR